MVPNSQINTIVLPSVHKSNQLQTSLPFRLAPVIDAYPQVVLHILYLFTPYA